MPAYNAEKTIEAAICSIIRQSYERWELIIVNDGSTDNTLDRIFYLSKEDNRIKLISYKENKGRGYARQKCLEFANGALIAFLDADDLWHPNKLYEQVNVYNKYSDVVCAVACRAALLDSSFGVKSRRKHIRSGGLNKYRANTDVPFLHATGLINRDKALEIGYDVAKKSLEDDSFYKAYLSQNGGKYYMVDEILYYYREFDSWSTKKIWDYWWSGFKTIWSQDLSVKKIRIIFMELLKISLKLSISVTFGSDTIIRRRNVLMSESEQRYHSEVVKNIVGIETPH